MDLNKLMQQAQEMQAGLKKTQEELANKTVEARVAGGKVVVVANGAGDVQSITIDPSAVDPNDVEFLQDLVLTGVQEAIANGKAMASEEMGKLTGGLGIPGL